jgi:uncharacterized membrane protein YgdD (TMEM256/DUF423 family)
MSTLAARSPIFTSTKASRYATMGAVQAFLSVAFGAFGAHWLKTTVAPALLEVYETAARYQMIHALAILITALLLERAPQSRMLQAAGWLFGIGIALFSGSLYTLSIVGPPQWGAVTPFGGMCFLTGWLCLAIGFARRSA